MRDGIQAVWVNAKYKGDRARSVIAHADAGIGYIMLDNTGNKMTPECLVAFRFVPDEDGIPDHLVQIRDARKVAEYQKKITYRTGADHNKSSREVTPKIMSSLAELTETSYQNAAKLSQS